MEIKKDVLKIALILFGIYVAVVIVIFISMLMFPTKTGQAFNTYTKYTSKEGDKKFTDIYLDKVYNLIENKNYNALYKIMSENFLKEKGLNESNFSNYLITRGYWVRRIEDSEYEKCKNGDYKVYINGSKKVFSIYTLIEKFPTIINVVEISPYDIKVSFGYKTYEEAENKKIEKTVENIKFEINRTFKNNEELNYEVKITNEGNDSVEFDFVDVTKFKLKGQNNYQMSNNVSTGEDIPLTKQSSIVKNLVFYVPNDEQPDIKYLSISGVKINGEEKTVNVPMN
jgi:hypothetical protein